MTPRRGELWWVCLDATIGSEIAKTRPGLVMTTNVLNEHRRTIVIIPISSSPSAYPPIRVSVRCGNRAAVAVIDQIRAIAKERLRQKIGEVSDSELESVESALKQVLELP